MQRMTQLPSKTRSISFGPLLLAVAALASAVTIGSPAAHAQYGGVAQADYESSGYVTPAGMVPPEVYLRNYQNNMAQNQVMPVGWLQGSACDAAPCDSGYCEPACDTTCLPECSGCGGGQACVNGGVFGYPQHCMPGGLRRGGGLFANCKCGGCPTGNCGLKGCGLCNLRYVCIFCRGQGCSACQLCNNHGASSCEFLGVFLPYTQAGICAQRWYDISAELVWLGNTRGGPAIDVTSQGTGPNNIMLSTGDISLGMPLGARLSGALLFGVGGNIEVTYLGGQKWKGSAHATSQNPDLYSFISNYGVKDDNLSIPDDGFDDTDRSVLQAIEATSELHSGELNYRRRTVWPYCRFQGSWLVGLRYLRYNDRLVYNAQGEFDDTVSADQQRFFVSNDRVTNDLFGPQAGFDFWWNIMPGISMGVGAKGAVVNNNIDRLMLLEANSVGKTGIGTNNTDKAAYLGDFEAKLVYRVSHSWTFRTAYYALVMDEIGFATIDQASALNLDLQNSGSGNQILPEPRFQTDSLVLQGVSWGMEYMW